MAIPGVPPRLSVAESLSFANGEGGLRHRRKTPRAQITGNNTTPPGIVFIGESNAPFTLTAGQTLTVPFLNLPRQQSTPGKSGQASTIWVPVGAQLQFSLTPTLVSGTLASCVTQALDFKNTIVTGPTILGHHLWREFRAVLTDGGAGSTGTVLGRLSLLMPVPGDSNRPLRGIIT